MSVIKDYTAQLKEINQLNNANQYIQIEKQLDYLDRHEQMKICQKSLFATHIKYTHCVQCQKTVLLSLTINCQFCGMNDICLDCCDIIEYHFPPNRFNSKLEKYDIYSCSLCSTKYKKYLIYKQIQFDRKHWKEVLISKYYRSLLRLIGQFDQQQIELSSLQNEFYNYFTNDITLLEPNLINRIEQGSNALLLFSKDLRTLQQVMKDQKLTQFNAREKDVFTSIRSLLQLKMNDVLVTENEVTILKRTIVPFKPKKSQSVHNLYGMNSLINFIQPSSNDQFIISPRIVNSLPQIITIQSHLITPSTRFFIKDKELHNKMVPKTPGNFAFELTSGVGIISLRFRERLTTFEIPYAFFVVLDAKKTIK
ncbi:hypothetical protein EDI_045880 [Entamoeba dispar SAW760]|uniref:Uncharacterized protein n=1 Tax=Entamoeba dispar (strain ATCC PRA-260 / SAW760) TaxID=370354 RepID=B0EE28_ENTDS|nr:uncharacterized protein EDI_045880 [Entamoeba dispar SAW760]EDR27214.1 hypothetical protein EDI_045880 [Entamoeba dispar SAW760]|eukprot:EDR27214.1 hypothetical protein EDI_045880 [Entamoeba dispar SAW760]